VFLVDQVLHVAQQKL